MELLNLWLAVGGFVQLSSVSLTGSCDRAAFLMARGLSLRLFQDVTFTDPFFQRIHCLLVLRSLQREPKLNLKIHIPPRQDFITVFFRKSVTCSFGEDFCDFWLPAISLLGTLFMNSINGQFNTIHCFVYCFK